MLERCLEDLESRIDPACEDKLLGEWRDYCAGRFRGPVFQPARAHPAPPKIAWPTVRVNATLDNFDAMLLQQFRLCSDMLAAGNGQVPMVRANYGTPIMPVLFGAELFIMPDETDTLPASHAVQGGGVEVAKRLLDRGLPSLDQPYIQKVFECGRRFMAIKRRYPKIGKHVFVYHPDLQGPFDICEMIWGSEIFLDLYDHAATVHALLDLITRTYIRVLREWEKIVPFEAGPCNPHWGIMHPGRIMLRDDSAMNLSPEMSREFVLPYDRRLLAEFGGGAMHSCGKVDHFVPLLAEIPGLGAFNMSQPELNDVEEVLVHTVDRGVLLFNLKPAAAQAALNSGRCFQNRVHSS